MLNRYMLLTVPGHQYFLVEVDEYNGVIIMSHKIYSTTSNYILPNHEVKYVDRLDRKEFKSKSGSYLITKELVDHHDMFSQEYILPEWICNNDDLFKYACKLIENKQEYRTNRQITHTEYGDEIYRKPYSEPFDPRNSIEEDWADL